MMAPIPQQIIDLFFKFPRDFRFAAEKIIGKTIQTPEDFNDILISDIDFGRLVVLFSRRPKDKNKFILVPIKEEILPKRKKKKKKRKK